MAYALPDSKRYERPDAWFRRCGNSGLMLPAVSLGCWHNFGGAGTDAGGHADEASSHESAQAMVFAAFDAGITHIDLANNYGPPPGSAESRVGRILHEDLAAYRDELIISTKAGYRMWPGPYGEWGSRKYLLSSLDQSLKRLRLDYVDLFYSHRPDPDTPLEETLAALDHAVRSGKALYVGISSYSPEETRRAVELCQAHGWATPIIHQPSYSMFNRWIEDGLVDACGETGLGLIPFSPLAQGLLTNKYLDGVPERSRAATSSGFLQPDQVTPGRVVAAQKLNAIAGDRGQSLAQMALAWVLRDGRVTSALIGASRPEQVKQCAACQDAGPLSETEQAAIEAILAEADA
ncbi:MAG: aldo/keto reductase [Planctomycetota bacterium]